MKLIKLLMVVAVVSMMLLLETLLFAEEVNINKMVDAIFMAEGGYKATYLYGIRSISYKDEAEARQICYNSVRNNIKRWKNAGKPEGFISFMSRRYCPINAKNDPSGLNRHWVKNVKYYYEKEINYGS